jgi:hypothetical protein
LPVVSAPQPLPFRQAGGGVGLPTASLAWVAGWLAGQVLATVVAVGAAPELRLAIEGGGKATVVRITPIPVLAGGVALVWACLLGAMWWASRRGGSGDFVADYRWRVRPVDLVGLPIGVLTQLVVVRGVYLPLEAIWPDTFSDEALSRNAEDLVDRAAGASALLLVLVVVVGAPVVEELVYRGMLQGALTSRLDDIVGVVIAAAWFAVIHFRPVEYPGLFAFAVVAGICAVTTRRLGMATLAHVAFNATGLYLAWHR